MELMQPTEDDMVKVCEYLDGIEKAEISRKKSAKHIPLKYINFMFKNFGYVPNSSYIRSKKFNPQIFGMDLDGDIITAKSRNPFKSKYCYELVVDVERKYFTIVRIVHYKNNMCYHDYIAKRPCELSKTM